ncbi:MAG TPA: glycosyltransferase [Bryobacteraceae bacterium]
MAANRTASLRPEALKSYIIDGLDHLKQLGEEKLDIVWRQQIAPYQSRSRHIWPALRAPRSRPLHVLSVKAHFDTTIDIMIGNYEEILAGDFAFTFMPQTQTYADAIRCADVVILYRAIDQQAEQLAAIGREYGKPVVFLMDDDLTTIYELSDEFSYLAPGTPGYLALQSLIRGADLVITCARAAQESVEKLNSRNVVLETNLRETSLTRAKLRLSSSSENGQGPLRIGFAGGSARRDEFAMLWPAIVKASVVLGNRAEFHFWGFEPPGLEQLRSPWHTAPFTFSYEQYLDSLTSTGFDVMIAPLFAEKRAKRAKSPIKFLEITAAGAIGVYSDVEPYLVVIDGVTGFKCQNTVEAWTEAILKAANLSAASRHAMVATAIQVVERDFSSKVQAPRMAATLEAAVLHGLLPRVYDKARIAYICHSPYLGGAENHLLRHATLASLFQFEPLLVLPSQTRSANEELQRRATALGIAIEYLPVAAETEMDASRPLNQSAVAEIRRWLNSNGIALVHSVVLMREVGEATRRAGIPHVASLYQTSSAGPSGAYHCDVVHSDSLLYANRWGEILGTPAMRIPSFVPDEYFDVGVSPRPRATTDLTVAIFGTLQTRKGQLQAIEAAGLLKTRLGFQIRLRLFGYDHFYPDYLLACKQMAERYGISEHVEFSGFVVDTPAAMRDVDVVLCASDWESLPQAVLEAMAAGCLVIATGAGGIGEVVSRRTGILLHDNSAASICAALEDALKFTPSEWSSRTDLAREVARAECSKYAVATELFRLYRKAVDIYRAACEKIRRDAPETATAGVKSSSLSAKEVSATLEIVRSRLHELNGELGPAE